VSARFPDWASLDAAERGRISAHAGEFARALDSQLKAYVAFEGATTPAQGVLGGNLEWPMIRQGAMIGVVAVIVDEVLKRVSNKRLHLPPLAIGMGIYLPLEADLLIPFGAVLGWFYNRWAMSSKSPAFAERMGVLMATGLIVGESLMGVIFAFAVAGAEKAGAADSANVFGLIQPFFYGATMGLCGCYFGFHTRGGAEGVGRATTRAVVFTLILMVLLVYFLSSWFVYVMETLFSSPLA
jgi:hypothetical protein